MSLILKYDLGNPRRLPAGYTPLAYIESSGTLYIDSGITPNCNKLQITFRAQITNDVYSNFFGAVGDNSNGGRAGIRMWTNPPNNANTLYIQSGDYIQCSVNKSHTFDIYLNLLQSTSSIIRINDVTGTLTSPNLLLNNNILVFASNLGTSSVAVNGPGSFKMYSFRIVKDLVLVSELIPAKRNSDEVVGMFDIVSQTFKTNAGTGAFIAGPEVVVLPYEYLLVEYLHAAGSQWFDTGIKIFHKTTYSTFEISSLFSVDSIHNYDQLWGTPGDANRYEQWINSSGVFNNRLANIYSTHSSMTANTMINYTCTGNVSNSLFVTTVNGSSVTKSYSPEDWNYNLYFLKSDYLFTGKVFNFKMTGNGTLIRNFIPCYRRSDLKPGMYDTVNNVFYTNSGSGEFILGPVVEESSRQLEYNNAGSNYIGKPTNIHHSTSNPSSTLINLGSGDFSGGATIRTTIPALNNSYSISWWASGVYGNTMMWSINYLNPLYNLCLNTGDGYQNPWYKPGTTTQIATPSNNVWHHFVITGDGSSNKLYVDGVHYGTSKTYKSCSGTTLGLNYYLGLAAYQWNGKMYDFRIYNNVLTSDEVLKIYKGGL